MNWHLSEVDGDETQRGDGSPLDSLIAFYRAFNIGDLAGLEDVWVAGSEPSMDNPIGGIRRGWGQIAEGYSKLFEGLAKVHVTFHDFTSQGGEDWHLFVGRERGVCRTATETLDVAFRTTRWFVRKQGGWRQLHHHGSVEDPQMLADYQRLIFG
ncbi:YybH family protein [Rhizobium lentis]|uniref:YybH family protein n=1 Tax=Rhizobium lentis TaxID=1138194 RepID=UPI001C828534|nr:nuclear transport factor 2 family protein [Rhizobium lentis]MBX4959770.1 SnoaL-like domain-containing protein [Rhizobium lentis]MBX4975001.1 SnoaL-like domain-containing protein [Rhizobium lentis]MBX4989766.1 SnoaL-like domain-containing protein [Rhizobium lentis]MBX5008267.1 SnoaL-like domain-containing protein [Rhizobium lentis]MBX5014978.1 SnoaL-like domain-containing protein [Rhizobium lentis]